jgi:hypothetical protein
MIKLRMRFAEHARRIGETKNLYGILVGQREGKNYLGDLGADERIVLRAVLNN